MAVTPDGATAFVTSNGLGTVTPINVATKTAQTPIPVGGTLSALSISPDGATAFVSNNTGNNVIPLDLATRTPGPPIPVGANPDGSAVTRMEPRSSSRTRPATR